MNKLISIRTIKSFSFFQNLNYISNNKDGSIVLINKTKYQFKERASYVCNYISSLRLTSINSYNEGIKNIFTFKYNIPLVLSNTLILIPTNSYKLYENIWINYSEIKDYIINEFGHLNIIFKDQSTLETKMNLKYYNKQLEKILMIKDYLLLY